MNSVQVNEAAYRGAGWAWGLRIGGGAVVHARFVNHPDNRAPTVGEVNAALDAFTVEPTVVDAFGLMDAAWDALQAAEGADADDEEIERLEAAFDACSARVQLGMMSGGAFYVDFTKAEHARAGLNKLIYV